MKNMLQKQNLIETIIKTKLTAYFELKNKGYFRFKEGKKME